MPYFIKKTADGWDTIKDDGAVIGSHSTKKAAIAQMVAVSLAEKIAPGGEKRALTPPAGVAEAAKRAIAWIDEGKAGSGFTAVGRRRASQLASGEAISLDVANRMRSYFARHEVDKQATGFNRGEDGFPSAGRVAWDAWGGDAGQDWVNGLAELESRAEDVVGISDIDDTLIVDGKLNQAVYDWLTRQPVELYLVTARSIDQQAETLAQLDELGIEYEELYMRESGDAAEYKGKTAEEIMTEHPIAFAVENNADARAAYRAAGVVEVYDPKDLPEIRGNQTGDKLEEGAVMSENNFVTLLEEMQTKFADWSNQLRSFVADETPEEPATEEPAVRFADPATVQENRDKGEKLMEQRTAVGSLEIREDGDGMTFSGYASVFDAPSQPLPFTEVVKPGAFKRSLQARNDIKLLWNHDSGQVLGSTRAGTLQLSEDSRGLFVTAKLPNTSVGRDAAELIKRGDVNAMSFGFSVPSGGDSWSEDGSTRELNSVRLHEISIVAFPAYSQTAGTTSVRSLDERPEKGMNPAVLRMRLELINKK